VSDEVKQEYSVDIAASPEDCFATLIDFDAYPQWSSNVSSARVLERNAAGLPLRVAMELDARIKPIRYVLEYRYKQPRQATWTLVEGDIRSVNGFYRFRKKRAGVTEATCAQTVDLGFWVPGPLRRAGERTALKQSVEEFKQAVEKRARR
jgi:ribosome-associated toxin RatA of RatAB toxin-antitoxin module